MNSRGFKEIIEKYSDERGALLGILEDIQDKYHYLPKEALIHVAERLCIPLSHVYRVATFYTAFSLKPKGQHLVKVCLGTACHVRGAGRVQERFERELGTKAGDTTEDLQFTLETVRCLGCCSLAPAVTVDEDIYGRLRQDSIPAILKNVQAQGGRHDSKDA
jgi:NADH-quinone oxidoreductase subunit E